MTEGLDYHVIPQLREESYIREEEEEEEDYQLEWEEDPDSSQAEHCNIPTTPCAYPKN